jgi:hypothetical protein
MPEELRRQFLVPLLWLALMEWLIHEAICPHCGGDGRVLPKNPNIR